MEHTARMAPRSWLITGASSGLGNAFARAALGAGETALATHGRIDVLVNNAGHGIVGGTRAWLAAVHGTQPGDPDNAAQAVLAALDLPSPSLRLALGEDAVSAIRAKITA